MPWVSTFINSLSKNEREKFWSFVREKTKDFSPPINDMEGWLAKKNEADQFRYQVYYNLFSTKGNAIKSKQNWLEHPQFQKALEVMRDGIPKFKMLGHPDLDLDKKTREAMVEFANRNNLIWENTQLC